MTNPQSTLAHDSAQEEWRSAVGFEGWYEVSNHGRVRRSRPGAGTRAGHILTPSPARGNYPAVCLRRPDGQRTIYVHHLVAHAFLGPCPQGKEVNHKDRNRWHPHADNLEYVTHQENMQHAADNGATKVWGERQGQSKLTEEAVRSIRASSETQRVLAKRYGVSQGVISLARRGITWGKVR